jgi:predicted Zn-dependent protease
VEDLARVTPKPRVAAALEALGEASAALADARYHAAVKHALRAKSLAPRDATVRETLALASYRIGDWQTALSELRAYRRLSGETTHLPVEMDVLRALQRPAAVENAWEELRTRGGKPAVLKEGLVVYASFLIDRGDVEEAYRLTAPERISARPYPQDLRVWYVAARAAALTGKLDEAVRLRNAILEHDPAFPGMDDLESTIGGKSR